MLIPITCKCGKQFRVDESMVGETVYCMSCSMPLEVARPGKPKPPVAAPPVPAAEAAGATEPSGTMQTVLDSSRDYVYWLLALAFFPLAIILAEPDPPPFSHRVQHTLGGAPDSTREQASEILQRIEDDYFYEDDFENLFQLLPGQRLEGAAYSRFSSIHWLFTGLTVLAFAALLSCCFTRQSVPLLHLVGIGLFTGTIGVVILFLVQLSPIGVIMYDVHFQTTEQRSSFWTVLIA